MLAITSCNANKEQCWKLTVGYPEGKTTEYYFYGTGDQADAQLEIYHKAGANKVSRSQTFKSKEDCHE
jgi:hypothetical protein